MEIDLGKMITRIQSFGNDEAENMKKRLSGTRKVNGF